MQKNTEQNLANIYIVNNDWIKQLIDAKKLRISLFFSQ